RGVEFVELDLSGALTVADGRVTMSGAPAVLLDAGAAAFGTYEAGEEFDPVTAEFSLGPDCAEAIASPRAPAADTAPAAAASGWILWLVLGLARKSVVE